MPGPRVTSGDRVSLRTVETEDVPFCQRSSVEPEIRIPMGNPVRNREQIDVPDDDSVGDSFLVCLDGESEAQRASEHASGQRPRADDAGAGQSDEDDVRRIGGVHVDDVDYRRPDLAYWLVPEVHGEGYGKEALSLLVDYVFRTYDHPAVGAVAYEFNDASRGLLESLGFEEEGQIRRDRFIDGEYVDTVHYGLLREDWWGEE